MIRISYLGRMGNNLFQYVFGRILHEETGIAMGREPSPEDFEHYEAFPNAAYMPGSVGNGRDFRDDRNADDVLERALTQCHRDEGIILHGYFQNWKYYEPYRERIRTWLSTPPVDHGVKIGLDDWIMHWRHEDYLVGRQQLGKQYYEAALRFRGTGRLYMVGKDLMPDMVRDFEDRHGMVYVQGASGISDFNFLKSFANIICANSTFSWWASYLSDATTVIVPSPATGYWSPGHPQRLQIPGRHVVVDDPSGMEDK